MPTTTKAQCETCDFSVTVENDISPEAAISSINSHLEVNTTHSIVQKTVWTDNPYIPPSE